MNRRRFVVTSASLGAVAAAAAAGCASRFGENGGGLSSLLGLRVPAAANTLTVKYVTTEINGKKLRGRTYGGAIPGPTIVTRPGSSLDVAIVNNLPRNPPAKCPTGTMSIPEIRNEDEAMGPPPKRYVKSTAGIDCMNNPHEFNTTNLHTHGIQTTPHLFDPIGTLDASAPMLSIEPGQSFRYQLPVPDDHPSGLHWYHPHHHGATDVQVSNGMAGLIVVRGPIDDVPEIAAAAEVFLAVQSLQVNDSKAKPGQYDLEYKAYETPANGGYWVDSKYTMFTVAMQSRKHGDAFNGVMWTETEGEKTTFTPSPPPSITVRPGEVTRLRLLNGTNQSTMPLALPGMEVWQIGFDGVNLLEPSLKDMSGDVPGGLTITNFIEAPVRMTVPGNRIEFLIKAPDQAGTYTLSSLKADDLHGIASNIDLLQFVVAGEKVTMGIPKKLPKPTREYPVIPAGKPPRKFTLSFKNNDVRVLTGFEFLVNNTLYDEMQVPTNVELGAEEEWTIENSTGSIHPFHLHVNSFQLVAINDVQMDKPEIWDTFYVPPKRSRTDGKNGSITFRVRFVQFKGKSVHHCHFLSHEDTGMMQNFTIH